MSVRYSVAYGLGGFTSPRPGSQVAKSARKIRVRFRLTDAAGHPLTSWISRWLASTHRVRATLSGRGIRRVTAGCGWNSWARSFNCVIRIPAAARTGWRHRYFITAYENTGAGFVRARAVGRAVNPETIHFK